MAVSSDTKLSIYNAALRALGSRELATLSENREPRRVLDGIWGSSNNVVKYALSRGEWNFGLRTAEVDYTPSIEPGFGFSRAFDKPDDFARLAGLSADEYMRRPLTNTEYVDEATYWFADIDVLYVRYVSSGDDYGMNSAAWPESFQNYLAFRLAWLGCERITNSTAKKDRLERDMMVALKETRSVDAMAEGVKFLPRGGWSRSRGSN